MVDCQNILHLQLREPFPLFIPNTVIFHPVSLANGLLDISRGIAGSKPGSGVPTWPTLKLPLNAVSPRSQRATELAKIYE